MFRQTMLVALIAAALTAPAYGQSTGVPSFQSPYRAFARSEFGGVVSFPEPGGTGYEGMYRFGSGRLDVGVRGGLWDPIGLAPSSFLAGVEARSRVVTHSEDFPLDGGFVFGMGGNFRSGFSRFMFPMGVTLGRRINLENSEVSFSPYVQPTAFLRGGNSIPTDLIFALGLGADVRLTRSFDARVSVGLGDVEGVSLGAVWVH
jgi:hypothetical protein